MASTRRILLKIWQQASYTPNLHDCFRIRVEASHPTAMPAEVFRYLQRPIQPNQTVPAADYDGVCSSLDLEVMPVGQPGLTDNPPWFRLSYVDVLLPSRQLALELITTIEAEITNLILALNAADTLAGKPFEIWLGAPPPQSSLGI